MQRSIILKTLLLLSIFVTGSGWADWVKVDETKAETFYIDPASIRKEGNLRKVWEVGDNKMREKNGTMSSRARTEYDCKNERFRTLAFSTHSESMAHGQIILQGKESTTWQDIPPQSVGDFILKRVCAQ